MPSKVVLGFGVDDDGDVWINGYHVHADKDCLALPHHKRDVTRYLKKGTNLVAVYAKDCGGCRAVMLRLSAVGHVAAFRPQPGDYVAVDANRTLLPQTGITLEAWVTYDETRLSTGPRYPTVVRLNPSAGKEPYWLRVEAGTTRARKLAWGVRTSAGLTLVTYEFAPGELQKWTHVAATFDGKEQVLYVNGLEKARNTAVGPRLTGALGDLHIGNGEGTAAESWIGEIDELRVWPYARRAAEIRSTMHLALVGVPGAVSTWNLDENALDSSGQNHGRRSRSLGALQFGFEGPSLTPQILAARSFGAGTGSCTSVPVVGVASRAESPNPTFALTCVHTGPTKPVRGMLWIGTTKLRSPLVVSGAGFWLTPLVPVSVVPDHTGLVRLPLPIPKGIPTARRSTASSSSCSRAAVCRCSRRRV